MKYSIISYKSSDDVKIFKIKKMSKQCRKEKKIIYKSDKKQIPNDVKRKRVNT